MNQSAITLVIFLFTIIGFLLNKLPMAVTSLISMLLLVVTGCLEPGKALAVFSNPTILLMGSMFVVAAGFGKTQMVDKIASLLSRVSGGNYKKIMIGYILIAFALAQFIPSSSAVFGMVFPLALAMSKELKISPSKVMFPLGLVCITLVMNLPIGGAATTYAQYNALLETYGYANFKFGLLDPVTARIPVIIIVLIYSMFLSHKFTLEEPTIKIQELESSNRSNKQYLDPVREVIGYVVFIAVTLGLLFQKFIGLDTWVITMIGAVLIVATGILNDKEAILSMNLQMLFLVAGSFALGSALDATGAGKIIGDVVAKLVGGSRNGYIFGGTFFIVPFLLTQVMSNLAVANVFVPIAILASKSLGANPMGPMVLVWIGAFTAYMTPLSTPTAAMVMAAGGYSVKDMFKMGWLPAVLIAITVIPWVMTIFPAFP